MRALKYTALTAATGRDVLDTYAMISLMEPFIPVVLYIDNSQNASPFTATINANDHRIKCPPGKQGYFPIVPLAPVSIAFETAGGVDVPVELTDYPMPAGVWLAS